MQEPVLNNGISNLYFRYCLWADALFAHFALFLRVFFLFLARFLHGKIQRAIESFAQILYNFAVIIVRPKYAFMWMNWWVTLKAVIDTLIISLPCIWASYRLNQSVTVTNLLLWLLTFGLLMLCSLLASIAFVSGDVYLEKRDEFQDSVFKEAAVYTLRIISGLLILLFISYLFLPPWRNGVFFHLGILLFITRMLYIIKLVQLRWHDMASLDLAGLLEMQLPPHEE